MSGSLQPMSVAAQGQIGTPYYGLVWLALASLAYTDESALDIQHVGADLPKAIGALPDPPAPPGFTALPAGSWGRWQMEWGPAYDHDNSNLMYAVSYREIASGLPIFAAIGIRGTDTQEHRKVLGLIRQIYEDLDVEHSVHWSQVMGAGPSGGTTPTTDATIAQGTFEGLKILRSLTPNGINILTFVHDLAAANPKLPIVVTGHSLGGCQTMVMAAYLSDALSAQGVTANLVPHPFAGPSPGNAAFAEKFNAQFPGGHIWWNTLDVVPNAFQNIANAPGDTPSLTNIRGFWQAHGGPGIDLIEKLALDAFIDLVHHYVQPTVNVQTLRGSVVVPKAAGCTNNWATQLMIQHFPPQYHYLMSTQLGSTVAPYPLPSYPGPCFQVPALVT